MKRNHYTSLLFCLIFSVAVNIFCADEGKQAEIKKGESRRSRVTSMDIYALLKSTTSSSDKEDEKDTYAERDVSSGGSGSEAIYSSFQHSMTPPLTASGTNRITRKEENDVDSRVLEQVARFSLSAATVHSAFAHVLEEQYRHRCLISSLQARMRAQEKGLERTDVIVNHIADNACDASSCRQCNRDLITKRIEELSSKFGLETYLIRKQISALEDSLRQMEDVMRDVELRAERIEIEQKLSSHEGGSSSSNSSYHSKRSKREPIKGKLTASSSSGSDPDISPFNLVSQEIPGEEALPPLDLDAQQSTQKLLEKTGNTTT